MRLPLIQWAETKPSPEVCADMTAQILEYVRKNGGVINPDCFEVETAGGESFCELFPVRTACDFHSTLRPLKIEGNSLDGVFVAALVLYIMLTGSAMDMSMAKMLLIAAQTGQSTPLMHVPTSSLNDLIEQMSDVNPGTRITPEGALDRIAQQFPGSADIIITENQTGAEIQRTVISLDRGESVWKPQPFYEREQQKFFPVDGGSISVPYRLKKQNIVCKVQPQQSISALESGITGKRCFGMDIGSTGVRISLLNEDGKVTDIEYNGTASIPAVIAYRSEGKPVFAEETDEPDMCRADKLLPFAPTREETVSARTADGSTVQVSCEEQMKALFGFIAKFMRDTAGFVSGEDKVAFAINNGCSLGWKNTLMTAAKTAGIDAVSFPSADAQAAAYIAENPTDKRLMTVNAGYSGIEVNLIQGADSLTPERAGNAVENSRILFAAPGGSSMTGMLAKSIMQTVLMRTGMNLHQREESLSPSQYADNLRAVNDAAESIKCRLSFAQSAEETVSLCGLSGSEEKVPLVYTRQQTESMFRSMVDGIRTVARQCLDSEKTDMSAVGTVLLCGRSALMPAVQSAVRELAGDKTVMLYDVVSAARGAALLGGLMPETAAASLLTKTENDIGTMTADIVSGLPQFKCLLPAGSPFDGDFAEFDYTLSLVKNDLNSAGQAVIKLYSRRAGMEHVTSILDPEGTAISYLGQIRAAVPEKFDFDSDKLCIEVRLDSREKITASAVHLRKAKGFGKLLSKFGMGKEDMRGDYAVVQSGLTAEYFPDNG